MYLGVSPKTSHDLGFVCNPLHHPESDLEPQIIQNAFTVRLIPQMN